MIIQSSNVNMNSSRNYVSKQEENTSITTWGSSSGVRDENMVEEALESADVSREETTEVKEKVQKTQQEENPYKGKTKYQIQSEVINYLLDLFFGDGDKDSFKESMGKSWGASAQKFGGVYTKSGFFHERETTTFQTTGSVVTADGRELSFRVHVEMTRSFTSFVMNQVQFGAERLCDPLVINLNSNVASVSDQKFLFDLDMDEEEESISMPSRGSGFLALDKNGNGKIDDGSELFGAKSGDGFADLEEYDIDKNGWIDEADAIFDKLRIWVKDEKGNDKLLKLKEAGVGAIYLKNAQTQFSLNSRYGNRTNAYIRKTGIFLYENGGTGTVQHLDLVQ
ncbi:MAG: hypothetical protein HFI37_05915 [Lachnospiraceae bacterium]|nr:hypothetical protein [Lachnospiraceae bacterium]